MKYNQNDALKEILLRRERFALRRRTHMLTYATALLTLLLTIGIGSFASIGAGRIESVPYGAFLLPSEAGGYVFAAVVALVLGIGVTLLCLWWKNRHNAADTDTVTHSVDYQQDDKAVFNEEGTDRAVTR